MLFTMLLLIGGFMWTQVISRSTAIASSLNAHQLAHQQTMDDLNNIASRSLDGNTVVPKSCRCRLTIVIKNDKDLDRFKRYGE